MKKIVVILMLLLCNISHSQEKGKVDFSVGVGFVSSNFMFDVFSDILPMGLVADDIRSVSYTPAINATIKYAVRDNWFFSVEGVYESIIDDLYKKKEYIGQQTALYYTFGMGTEYHYLNRKYVQLYSGGAIGYTFQTLDFKDETENNSSFNLHLNVIGLRVGKKIAGTLELGFGYKGLVNVGLSYQP